jgi:hypothetical protein
VSSSGDPRGRRAALAALAGAATVFVSIPLAAVAGAPYLSAERLNPWLALCAVGLFGLLFAIPFVIHGRLHGELEADARWERALLWWGGTAIALLALGGVYGLAAGFDPDSLAGSLAIVAVVEALLVLGTLGAWLVSG